MSAVVITCSSCGRALQVPGEYLGKTVQCPDCKHSFTANAATGIQSSPLPPPPAASSAPAPAESKPAWDDDEPPERRPLRRRDRDDDDDDDDDFRRPRRDLAPDRGGMILAIGIISLMMALIGFGFYFLPVGLVPMLGGVIGWVLGSRDQKAMREGTMDRSNQAMTQIGWVLSIVGFFMGIVQMLLFCMFAGFIALMIGVIANNPPPPRPGPPRVAPPPAKF